MNWKANEKAQVATEYLSVIAVMLVFLAILVGVALTTYYSTVKIQQVSDSLEELEYAANNVFALGQGNSLKAKINLPQGVQESYVGGRKISFTLAGMEESLIYLDMNVHGSLPTGTGIHYIKVQAVDGNVYFEEI